MQIATRIAHTTPEGVTVRGQDLVEDLIGVHTFTEMLYFLTIERFPTPAEAQVLDACLVTLMEHGWTPSSLIARFMIDSVPDEVQVAMSSGLLAVGSVFAGTSEECAKLLKAAVGAEEGPEAYFRTLVPDLRARRAPIPGFGHPVHKPDDPRAARLIAVARRAGMGGAYVDALLALSAEVDRVYGKHITINATGAIGALLLEIGFEPQIMRGVAVVSRAGGLLGHIVEERKTGASRRIWQMAEDAIPYAGD